MTITRATNRTYKTVRKILEDHDALNGLDELTVQFLADQIEMYKSARDEMKASKFTIEQETSFGTKKVANPTAKALHDIRKSLLDTLAELGMTPKSRKSDNSGPDDALKAINDFLNT